MKKTTLLKEAQQKVIEAQGEVETLTKSIAETQGILAEVTKECDTKDMEFKTCIARRLLIYGARHYSPQIRTRKHCFISLWLSFNCENTCAATTLQSTQCWALAA